MNFFFFSLSSLCQSLHLFSSNTDPLSLIPSYFLPHHQFSSTPTPTPTPTPTHHFHADLSLAVVFLFVFFFFFFFCCGLMGGLGNGWLWMDRSVVGGFGWADRCPPRSTVHLTLSDQIALVFFFFFFFFFLVYVGCVSWVVMG